MSARGGERRRAREYALQLLFQLDLCPAETGEVLAVFWSDKNVAEGIREFAGQIVTGTMAHREAIDEILASTAHHWRIDRMAVVDRNIIRMAIWEFLYQPETPRVVVIDEAIEIAKKFGNEDSGVFVNGILDAIRIRLENDELSLPDDAIPPTRSTA